MSTYTTTRELLDAALGAVGEPFRAFLESLSDPDHRLMNALYFAGRDWCLEDEGVDRSEYLWSVLSYWDGADRRAASDKLNGVMGKVMRQALEVALEFAEFADIQRERVPVYRAA